MMPRGNSPRATLVSTAREPPGMEILLLTAVHTPRYSSEAWAYFPAGVETGSAIASWPLPIASAMREIWPNGQRKHAVGRGNEDKSVAEQVLTRAWLDQIALGKIIHRGNITGEEKIAWHPSLDLLGERCARPISGHGPGAVLTQKIVVRLVECLLEGDRSEHHNIAAFSASRKDERSE